MEEGRVTTNLRWTGLLLCGLTAAFGMGGGIALADTSGTAVSANSCSGSASTAYCLAATTGTGATSPIGLSPNQVKAAYGWPSKLTVGAGQTIAIVDARDNPVAESDLAAFDQQYGLPACTGGNGCFSKVDASGGTNFPSFNAGWAFEIALDIQWAHAIAPGAKVLLVEAKTANIGDMLAAEDYARQHAQYVSNSWVLGVGNEESKNELGNDSRFVQSGVSFFAASGDVGFTAFWPSTSPDVISVGGTQLNFDSNGNFVSETGWPSGGGGCSKYETANPIQSGFASYAQVGCNGFRATPDVAAVAMNVSVYDSNPFGGQTGNWFSAFGTSIGSPLWAARAADAGIVVNAATVYSSAITFRDISSGGNGAPCLFSYNLCAGRGSWIGTRP